jgi:hypothetical protein
MCRTNCKDKVAGCPGLSFMVSLKRNFNQGWCSCLPATARTRLLGVLGSPLGSTKVVVPISRQVPGASTWWLRIACPGGPHLLMQQSNRSCAGPTARTRLLGVLGSPLGSHLNKILKDVVLTASQQQLPEARTWQFRISYLPGWS